MRGYLYYMVGDEFDASADVWDLRAQLHATNRYAGFASAVGLLVELAIDGYASDRHAHMLQSTSAENLMLFEDAGVRLGFDVPGNGRASTPDVALLGAEFYDVDPHNPTDRGRTSFITTMRLRRKRRTRIEAWTIADPSR